MNKADRDAIMNKADPRPNRRYVERTVRDLRAGDVFSLDDGATYHECVSNDLYQSGQIGIVDDADQVVGLGVSDFGQTCLVQVDYVKVAVQFTLVVDVAAWATEYGIDRADVTADARGYFAPEEVREAFIPKHLRSFVAIKGGTQDPLATR